MSAYSHLTPLIFSSPLMLSLLLGSLLLECDIPQNPFWPMLPVVEDIMRTRRGVRVLCDFAPSRCKFPPLDTRLGREDSVDPELGGSCIAPRAKRFPPLDTRRGNTDCVDPENLTRWGLGGSCIPPKVMRFPALDTRPGSADSVDDPNSMSTPSPPSRSSVDFDSLTVAIFDKLSVDFDALKVAIVEELFFPTPPFFLLLFSRKYLLRFSSL
mmetsp:Transcript_371/g.805  ORF Transcript_371/g.805 Transcript_371/m.805 type:complete len:212 (+) Transcript_371:924-1559(+)